MGTATVIEGLREEIRAALDRPEMEGRQMKLIVMPGEGAGNPLLDQAIARMTQRSSEEIAAARKRALDSCKPGRPLPPGKTLGSVLAGQWPGDESDEQIQAALDELS